MMPTRECKRCRKPFSSNRGYQKFCSKRCNNLLWQEESYKKSEYRKQNISTGTVGAIGELRVSADLLTKGFEVFRSVSPSASCDLAILKNGKLLRVEVRTGYARKDGAYWASRQRFRADVFAIVLPDKIVYEPELEVAGNETTPAPNSETILVNA